MTIQPIGPGTYPVPPPSSVGARVAAYAHAAGFSGQNLIVAVAVSKAESGWEQTAKGGPNSNGTFDWGLWQINDVHNPSESVKTNGAANAREAYKIYTAAGKSFKPWAAYNNGSYKKFIDDATAAVKDLQRQGPEFERRAVENAGTAPEAKDSSIGAALSGPASWVQGALGYFGKLADNYLAFVAGAVLLVIGAVILLRKPIAKTGVTVAKNATPAGRAVTAVQGVTGQ